MPCPSSSYVIRLTARVVSLLVAAQHEDWENLLYVDPALLSRSVLFLLRHQQEDGGFREPNAVLDAKVGGSVEVFHSF